MEKLIKREDEQELIELVEKKLEESRSNEREYIVFIEVVAFVEHASFDQWEKEQKREHCTEIKLGVYDNEMIYKLYDNLNNVEITKHIEDHMKYMNFEDDVKVSYLDGPVHFASGDSYCGRLTNGYMIVAHKSIEEVIVYRKYW